MTLCINHVIDYSMFYKFESSNVVSTILQALQQGSVQELLPAAAAKRNSMCGLYPLAVALEALYGASSSDSSNSGSVQPSKPQLLEYKPAHMIYQRPDSTGFAAFVIYQ